MWSVFKKALRDSRWTILGMSVGLGLYALLIAAFYPTIQAQAEQMTEMMESLPEGMIAMFSGGRDVDEIRLDSPEDFLQVRFTTWMLLILASVGISQAFNAITNAERDGTMDVMMSLPVSRRAMFVGRVFSTTLGIVIALVVSWLALLLGRALWPELNVPAGGLAAGIFGAFFPVMVLVGLAYFLGAALPSSRHFGGAIAYLFMIGGYLIYSLSGLSDALNAVRPLMIYHYYDAVDAIRHGLQVGDMLVLGIAALTLFGLGWWRIDRKDLGV